MDEKTNVFRAPDPEHRTHLNSGRIIEAMIIAVIAAIGSAALTMPSLRDRLAALDKKVDVLTKDVRKIRDDFYVPRGATPQAAAVPVAAEQESSADE